MGCLPWPYWPPCGSSQVRSAVSLAEWGGGWWRGLGSSRELSGGLMLSLGAAVWQGQGWCLGCACCCSVP